LAQEDHSVRGARAACATLHVAACVVWAGAVCAGSDPLEVVVVTGSRIGRADLAGPTPVVSIPARVFEQTGAISLERTLDLYPQVLATAGSTSNSPSNDGQANVSLRGLGPNRTLVLLDGRRLMPADGNGAVDLNTIPPALVESVELMTGGASAAYGSDAIAGVVNVRLRQRFEGIALEGSTASTERGDGATHSAGITAGTSFGGGAGSVMAYAGYARRDGIRQDERAFSRYPLQYVAGLSDGLGPGGSFIGSGSAITQEGFNVVFAGREVFNSIFEAYGYAAGTVPQQAGISVNADGSLFTTGNGTPGSVVNYRGDRDAVLFNDRQYAVYNFAPDTALQMPLERASGFLRGSYAFDDALELHAQVLYADYSVERQLAPTAAGILLIPPTNPFIPPDLRALLASRPDHPTAPYRYFRRMSEVGPQAADNDRSVLQWTVGARGKLGADWAYDVYAQYGANDRSERQTNSVSLSRMQDLTFAADGGISICEGGFDPFRAVTLSSECARYIALAAENDVRVRQSITEAAVNGPAWALPGGALQLALGLLYKKDEFDYRADAALSALLPGVPGVIGPRPDVSGFAAAPNRSGDAHNVDAYVEALLPLLGGRHGVESLELGLGYRYSDHSRAGDVDSYKAELSYRPVARFQLRSSLQHAVRAPSIEELYYPPVPNQFLVPMPDPCDARSTARNGPDRAAVEALCLGQGVPAALLPNYRFELRRVDGVSGGNPELQPEEADTATLGFVYTWTSSTNRAQDLRVSLDGYQIEIERGIGRWDSESAVARCFNRQYNPTFDVANVYCTFFSRDPITGNIYAEIRDRNIGGIETAGVDLQLDWGIEAGPGQLTIGALGSYVDYWRYLDPSGGRIEYAGTVGGGGLGRTLPEWKSLLNLGYAWNGFALDARWRHLDGASDVNVREFKVPSYDYLDLGVRYAFEDGALEGASIWVGVDNVFNEDPPIFPTWQQANTDPSVYDVLGRSFYLRLRYEFQ
jgi:iron complex outermembrane recepter protein